MRKLRNVEKSKSKELQAMFPDLLSICDGPRSEIGKFTYLAISVFEGWLGKENYHLLENVSDAVDSERKARFKLFHQSLFQEAEIYRFYFKGVSGKNILYKSFLTAESFYEYCGSECSNNIALVIPKYECIYVGGFDYTNIIYYKSTEKIAELIRLVQLSGLYTIKHWAEK